MTTTNWVMVAMDKHLLSGTEQSPYTLKLLGKTLIDQGARVLNHLGGTVTCISDFTEEPNWLDAYGESCVVLLDAAVYFTTEFYHVLSLRERQLMNEQVIYYVNNRPVAILARAKHLKSIWRNINPNQVKETYLSQISELLNQAFEDRYEDALGKHQGIVIENLVAYQQVNHLLRQEKLNALMLSGVMVMDSLNTYIDQDVSIGAGSVVYPGSFIEGDTVIGTNCKIGPAVRIQDSQIGHGVTIKDSTIVSSRVDDMTTVGPYAYLRPKSDIGKHVKIGDFVEVKNARIDDGSKVSHLSYIGDGHVGKDVNIGCGVVFVNYDGKNKFKTVVEDGAFIGCNVNLVAPVTVQKGAYVAAGSTITEDVLPNSLAIARSRQTQKLNWVVNKGAK